ncbi:hypothetical protein S7711_11464 [Stachybotrys chartarum IBT 7711]|uniref:Uncharacterized protein n=1 Tax=Stachybotrys chartarum (strain CBS 109288 / IBT 7711) TaxID=1280523 RepID=A0A084B9X3_STACB|nr:hypothetical protein S7711_11464 [Stachybotrys chartarum IBT 7711]
MACSTVEGWSGARTICAPRNGLCDSNNYNGRPGGVNPEQNFRSWAHKALRNNVFDPPGRHGVYRFYFLTCFNTDIEGAAAEVNWYGEDATLAVGFGQVEKRYLDETPAVHRAVESFYGNGTSVITRQLLQEEEYKVLRRHWIDNLHGNASSVDQGPLDSVADALLETRQAPEDTWASADGNCTSPAHQAFEILPQTFPLPIIEITRDFMAEEEGVEGHDRDSIDKEFARAVAASRRSDPDGDGG